MKRILQVNQIHSWILTCLIFKLFWIVYILTMESSIFSDLDWPRLQAAATTSHRLQWIDLQFGGIQCVTRFFQTKNKNKRIAICVLIYDSTLHTKLEPKLNMESNPWSLSGLRAFDLRVARVNGCAGHSWRSVSLSWLDGQPVSQLVKDAPSPLAPLTNWPPCLTWNNFLIKSIIIQWA